MPKETFWNLPEAKRAAFIEIALDEFATHDYENASLSRMVARMGIAKGSVYQYFEDKLDLYSYLLELALETKRDFLSRQSPPDSSHGVFATLHWLFKQGSAFDFCYPHLSQLGYRAAYGRTPLPKAIQDQARQGTTSYFEELVRRGQASGELDPAVDPIIAAFVFTALFEQLGRFLVATSGLDAEAISRAGRFPDDEPAVRDTFDQLLRLLQHGMGSHKEEQS